MADLFLKNIKYIYNSFGRAIFLLSAKFGYSKGGTVTQATDKTTAFTLNTVTGRIILAAGSLAGWTGSSAQWTNSFIGSFDVVAVNQDSGTRGAYEITFDCSNGVATMWIFNGSSAALNEAVAFRFVILGGSQS